MVSVYLSDKTHRRLVAYGKEMLARGGDGEDLILKLNPDLIVQKLLNEAGF